MSDNTDWPTGEEDEEEIRRESAPPNEADEDIAAGRVERFDSMEDAIRALWSEGINDAGEIIECIEDFRQQEKEDGIRQRDKSQRP